MTTAQTDQAQAKVIAANVQMTGHSVGTQDVMPITADTPIPRTKELEDVGAEIIGEDLSHMVGNTIGDITTGASTTRVTKSGRFLKLLRDKLLHKKNPDEEVLTK